MDELAVVHDVGAAKRYSEKKPLRRGALVEGRHAGARPHRLEPTNQPRTRIERMVSFNQWMEFDTARRGVQSSPSRMGVVQQ
jgi:hypothetical protein